MSEAETLRQTADIGWAYAVRLIEWFGTAERAIEYLTADEATKNAMLNAATRGK